MTDELFPDKTVDKALNYCRAPRIYTNRHGPGCPVWTSYGFEHVPCAIPICGVTDGKIKFTLKI